MSLVRGQNEWNPQKGNVGPQLGFAYNPDFFNKKMVFHGGYGLNYNQDEIAITANGSGNPNDAVTPLVQRQHPHRGGSAHRVRCCQQPDLTVRLRSQHEYHHQLRPNHGAADNQWSAADQLSLQPEDAADAPLLARHAGRSRPQPGRDGWVPGHRGGITSSITRMPTCMVCTMARRSIRRVTYIEQFGDTGGSNYNALLVDLKHNMSHQFSVDASFTYAKSMDDASGPYSQDPVHL